MFVVSALLLTGQCIHALVPPSKVAVLREFSPAQYLNINTRRKISLRNSLDDLYEDSWDEEASQAILDGQGNFFSFRGGAITNSNNFFTRCISSMSPNKALQSMKLEYEQRIAADPAFLSKSILEIVLAAATQYIAEVSRRGRNRILPEIDFVFAGILTAVVGKYYSMWRVARTVDTNATDDANNEEKVKNNGTNDWRDKVPTNSFQPFLLDGCTRPTLSSRILAFVLPMPQLFRAGAIASMIGYGLTSFLIRIRTCFLPQYVAATQPVSVPHAAIYTGLFMAFVSNIRYQLLQGVVEPYMIDGLFLKIEDVSARRSPPGRIRGQKFLRYAKRLVIVLVRWANGLIGSWIAIGGMRYFGLQSLKE